MTQVLRKMEVKDKKIMRRESFSNLKDLVKTVVWLSINNTAINITQIHPMQAQVKINMRFQMEQLIPWDHDAVKIKIIK